MDNLLSNNSNSVNVSSYNLSEVSNDSLLFWSWFRSWSWESDSNNCSSDVMNSVNNSSYNSSENSNLSSDDWSSSSWGSW